MQTYVAIRIHNNSLSHVQKVKNLADGLDTINGWAIERLDRALTREESDSIANEFEICNEDDADNIWCFAVDVVA